MDEIDKKTSPDETMDLEGPNKNEEVQEISEQNSVVEGESLLAKPVNVLLTYVFLTLVVIGIFAAGVIYLANTGGDDEKEITISTEKKNEIISEVIKNNPKGVVEAPFLTTPNVGNSPEDALLNTPDANQKDLTKDDSIVNKSPIPAPAVSNNGTASNPDLSLTTPNLSSYNYRHTKTQYFKGDQFEKCQFPYNDIARDENKYTTEYFEFFDADRSYYKSQSYFDDGELDSYYLSKYSKTESDWYNYNGGQIAGLVKSNPNPNFSNEDYYKSVSYPSDPSSYPSSYPSALNSKYGAYIVFVESYEKNGTTFYVFTYKHSTFSCFDTEKQEYDSSKNAFYAFTVNGETFDVVEYAYYINEIDEDNLISKTKIEISKYKQTYDQIKDIFDLAKDTTAEIVVADYVNREKDPGTLADARLEYLVNSGINPLVDSTGLLNISSLTGKEMPPLIPNSDYYNREEFYPETERGQKEYADRVEYIRRAPILSLYAYNNHFWGQLNLNIYRKSDLMTDEINNLYYSELANSYYDNVVAGSTTLMIDGEAQDAVRNIYEKTIVHPVSYPSSYMVVGSYMVGSYPVSYSYSYNESFDYYAYTNVVFEKDGMIYVLTSSDYSYNYKKSYNYAIESLPLGYFTNNYDTFREDLIWFFTKTVH